jgi:hypothetical protein
VKDFVSNRRFSILIGAAALSILWAVVVSLTGQPWTGVVWLGALAPLVAASAVVLLGTARPTSLETVIQGVENESKEVK